MNLPVESNSVDVVFSSMALHWINDPGFREAVDQFLQSERKAVAQDIDILTSYGPFKSVDMSEHD